MTRRFGLLFLAMGLFCPFFASAESADLLPRPYRPGPAPANAVWTAPNGSDETGDGSRAKPFLTPGHAASFGKTVLLLPGRYGQFGRVNNGGSDRELLLIRPASTTEPVIFAFQDANQPAEIAASHLRIEGVRFSGEELAEPGPCLRFAADADDVSFAFSTIDHCASGIDTGRFAWSHGQIDDVTFRDLDETGIACRGACLRQRWTRLRFEHLGETSASATAILVSERSIGLRLRDLTVRDILGDGAVFAGGRPSLANATFKQISETALRIDGGGFVGNTEIAADGTGLVATVGAGLRIENSLFFRTADEAEPFTIDPHDASPTSSALVIEHTRIQTGPGPALRLGSKSSGHAIALRGTVWWFENPDQAVIIPGERTVLARTLGERFDDDQANESQVIFGSPDRSELFSPLFSGGSVTLNEDGSRTITTGSLIRGTGDEPPYVLAENQRVHLLLDPERLARWYPYPVQPTNIGAGPFGALLRSSDITEPPGSLVKAKARPQVYLVVAPDLIRWVTSEPLAAAYAGPRWASTVIELPTEELTHYEEIAAIWTEAAFMETDALRQVADPSDLFE